MVNWPTPNIPERGPEYSKTHRPESGGIDLQSSVQLWPTPQFSEYKGMSQRGLHSPKDRLSNAVGLPDLENLSTNGKSRELWATPNIPDRGAGGQHSDLSIDLKCAPRKLNPAWVEQLMGLPAGWTDLDSSATASSINVQKKQSGL
jgi:hypothetical protein